ncbi:9013_t:CDS:2, partial [Paraglomus occultum]
MPDIEGLEKHYDVIVLGTGYTGSVLAAAFAQAGKSVLHMDENKCYGNLETAFQFEELLRWCKKIQDPVTTTGSLTTNGGFESPLTTLPCEFTKSRNAIYSAVEYKIYPRSSTEDPAMSASSSTSEQDYEFLARRLLKSTSATEVELVNTFKHDLSAAESEEDAVQAVLVRLHNIVDPYMYAPPAPEEEVASVTENLAKSKTLETFAELIKDSRKYSLELLPKLYYFKSDTIDLISQCKLDALTNIRDGVEFYPVKGIYMFSNNKDFVKVPVGRQEIFKETQQNLSMISKRRLSKLAEFAQTYTESSD